MDRIDEAAGLLSDRYRILVFTGAGISTESGIPDFRGPSGLWRTLDPSLFSLRRWVNERSIRANAWDRRFGEQSPEFEHNAGHVAVADLWATGRMIGCITQNVDGLHQAAGLRPDAVAEIHGNLLGIVCYERGHAADPAEVRSRWEAGDDDPRCTECSSILKSTTILFGEELPREAVARSQEWADAADAVIAIGSTLSVYPAADFALQVATRGDPFVIVNQGPTDHDAIATVRIEGKAGEALPPLVGALTPV
ncbi:MAG: NAD-dependent deacetylase [Acidimicrobiia bacterium]